MKSDRRYLWLPRISVERPVTVLMLFAALVVLGLVALVRLPVQLFPSGYDPTFMMVFVPYPNANPSEVEEKIVLPLEEALYTVRGIEEVSCTASGDSARCWFSFVPGTDMEQAYNEVADRVERLQATRWPEDVERVRIRRHNPNDDAPLKVGITLPPNLDDPYWLLYHRVVLRLERLPGVAQVDLEGVEQKQIFIEPDREALEAHRIDVRALASALRNANFALSSGDLRDGGRKLLVRSLARFRSLQEIEDLVIRPDGLRLKEVARVRYDFPPRERASRLDGKPAAVLEIFKESEANTIEVTSTARAELDRIYREEPWLAETGGYRVLFDQGEVIRDSIRQLRDTGLLGALFALVVLYVFLRRIRVTLLITLAIPTSLLVTLVAMYFLGESINVVTLMGLIICTGMLVDNAVVVVENIDRYRKSRLPVREAALVGASEIGLALSLATVTTVIVFLPMVLMARSGIVRFLFVKLAIPVVFAIGASLVVALLFVPLTASRMLRAEAERGEPGRVARLADRVYRSVVEPLHRGYVGLLERALRHRAVTVTLVLLVGAASVYPVLHVEKMLDARARHGGRQITFWFNLPNTFSLEEADSWFRTVEEKFLDVRERYDVAHLQTRFWHNRGMVRVILEPNPKVKLDIDEISAALRALIPERAGVQTFVNWQRGSGMDPSLTVSLYGEDTETLARIAEEAERRLRTLPGLVSVEPDIENALEEVRIRVARDRAERYGVPTEAVTGTVVTALRGQALPRFRQGEREIEIRVQFPEADREGIARLAALDLPSASGRRIPLEAVADLSISRGYGDIQRRDRRTTFNIKLNTTWDRLGELRGLVAQVMDGLELPRGYRWDFGSQWRWQQRDEGDVWFGLWMAIVFIYLIMGFLFESVALPLAVMPSIFLSWIGAAWLLWLTASKLDIMAAIGLVLLAGVVVNNGIVLVDLINRLRAQGLARTPAVVEAGRLRFRPILMTAMTTIMGMMPLAVGNATFVGLPYAGLGKVFVGGMISSASLTLFVVPVLYTLLDDAAAMLRALMTGRAEGATSAPETA